MLDELLGRAELKERIGDLEEEREHLRARLEAEEERRAEAVRERQDAEERVNRLEDRVAELEDRVERAGDEGPALAFRGEESLRGRRLERVLARLRSVTAPEEGALTAMVTGTAPDAVRDLLGERAALVERAAPCLVCADDARLVSAALEPPVAPDPFAEWGEGFRVEAEWFRPTGRFALALLRSDLFALGVYEGSERVAFEGFESDVKGDHSKGGFSQARFERRRDEQIADHVDRAREAVEAVDADRVYLLGERTVLPEVSDLATATARSDATGDPEDALRAAFEDFWTVRLRLL